MKIVKKYKWQIVIVLILILMAIFFAEIATRSFDTILNFAKEMLIVLPPVFIVVGLLGAWISQENIEKWLGQGSGLKGMLISMALGTMPAGPLYAAFPEGVSVFEKGASYRNINVFLSSRAALKIPHIMMEIGDMGVRFVVS